MSVYSDSYLILGKQMGIHGATVRDTAYAVSNVAVLAGVLAHTIALIYGSVRYRIVALPMWLFLIFLSQYSLRWIVRLLS